MQTETCLLSVSTLAQSRTLNYWIKIKACTSIRQPKRCTLEASSLPNLNTHLFRCLNNEYILLQKNGLGNRLTVTDPVFPLYLKQDTHLRIKDISMQTEMQAVRFSQTFPF